MGFVVPTQYIYWFELALIHVLVPGSSFFGHLCGIITGLLYTKVKHIYSHIHWDTALILSLSIAAIL